MGWPSAAFLALQSKDSPLQSGPLTTSEISWVGSILCIGGICGNMFFAWLSDKLGRKVSMLLAVLPLLVRIRLSILSGVRMNVKLCTICFAIFPDKLGTCHPGHECVLFDFRPISRRSFWWSGLRFNSSLCY